jgi:hypothetical protein
MPMQVQNLTYDSKGNRANLILVDQEAGGGSQVVVSFHLDTNGDDTQHQINERMKAKTKDLLQAAVALL